LNLDTKLEVDTTSELVSVDVNTTPESNDIPQIFFTKSFVGGGCLIV
jgi:hypothetical protein